VKFGGVVRRYNKDMRRTLLLFTLIIFVFAGCDKHVTTDYRPLDQAGMWFGKVQELKALHADDTEIAQIVGLKKEGISDDACVQLISAAHARKHDFASSEAVVNLYRAGFSEPEILDLANTDRIDSLSLEAVTLRLIGLSNRVVLEILHRRVKGIRTLSGPVIARLKNDGLSDAQVLERIRQGMTDVQAEQQAVALEHYRNKTSFVHSPGRKR
jgi:hypothetical protein